uniref:Uncharacterized protein n=1 Tax=Tetranychus urticae TaxID=32264 RepID=T1KF84_TETUR
MLHDVVFAFLQLKFHLPIGLMALKD